MPDAAPPAPPPLPPPGGRRVLHLALVDAWREALDRGVYTASTRGADVAEVGFVHASTVSQLPGVRDAFYADLSPADVVVLVLDIPGLERSGSPVRWEVADGAATAFPHVYGPVPVTAVVAALALGTARDPWALPDVSDLDVADRPPAP